MSGSNHTTFQYRPQRPLAGAPIHAPVQRLVETKTISSDNLFAGSHEIGIEHRGSLYRLTITRQGKLILNK